MFLKSIVHFINSFHICFYPDLLAIESQKEEKPAGQVTKNRTRPSLLSSRSGTAIVNPPPPFSSEMTSPFIFYGAQPVAASICGKCLRLKTAVVGGYSAKFTVHRDVLLAVLNESHNPVVLLF